MEAANGPYDAAFVRLQRQRQRHLGTLARALAALKPGGMLAVCGPNAMGGARLADDLAEMGAPGKSTSKHKCRLVVAVRPATLDIARFVDLDAPREVPAIGAFSAPGVFAWDRIDPGTTLLLETLPPLTGHIADLGAGWGHLPARSWRAIPAPRSTPTRPMPWRSRACAPICRASPRSGTT